jgi:hypothetical protein
MKPIRYLLNEHSYLTSKIVQNTQDSVLSQKRKSASRKSLGQENSQATLSTTAGQTSRVKLRIDDESYRQKSKASLMQMHQTQNCTIDDVKQLEQNFFEIIDIEREATQEAR